MLEEAKQLLQYAKYIPDGPDRNEFLYLVACVAACVAHESEDENDEE